MKKLLILILLLTTSYSVISQSIILTPYQGKQVIKDIERGKFLYEENLILYEQIEQYKLVINKAKMVESKQDSTILLLNTNLQYEKNNTETLTDILDITRKELKRQKRKSTILFGTTVTIGLLALIIAAK